MTLNRLKLFQVSVLTGLVLFLCSCATYNQRIAKYYTHVQKGDFVAANKDLDHNRLIKKDRNKLLYMLEKGKTYYMLRQPDSSNLYFNQADAYIEQTYTNAKDVAVGTLVNPMMERYKGEDFEKFMIHYYKALNYLYLNETEDAIVEARRIDLQSQLQKDKFKDKTTRYSKDAFSLMLQGLLYESAGDINNAFISYRNAVDVYLANSSQTYYGITMPKQLQLDLLRSAYLLGFQSDLEEYERKLNMQYQPQKIADGGELILFWENGFAPIKDQQEFFFSLMRDQAGFYFSDGQNRLPFVGAVGVNMNGVRLSDLSTFRVAFPKYVARPLFYTSATVSSDGYEMNLEKAEDINELAFETLRQRFVKEMATALSRLAVKKIAEYMVKGDGQNDLRDGIAFGMQLYSLFSEKADTRNWQTLPSTISYARIPLKKGKNEIQIKAINKSGGSDIQTININGTGGMTFYHYTTLK